MNRINLNDMNYTIDESQRLEYEGDLFTGEVVEEAAGMLFSQDFYVNGLIHGPSKEWWEDGSLRSEGEYFNGQPRGVYKEWHRNSRLAAEITYSDSGKPLTRREWDEQGNLISPRRRAARNT